MYVVNRFLSKIKPAKVAGIVFLALMAIISISAVAQTGGEGAIEGTVLDSTGAVVPNATVTAVNVNTGVVTTRPATGSGFFSITPLIPGTYTVTVTAKSFESYKQENIVIDALHVTGLNVHLTAGAQNETITITQAPPALETTNATLGGTIENNVYTALPIMLQTGGSSNQQRDVTSFSNLLPGAQVPPGGRSSIIGGTGQRVGEVYVDGLPLTTANQQGDNRPVYNLVPLEAIDQIQVVTSGFSAEYQGAGLENYSTKSGTNQYHGTAFGYFRNRIFDAWSFSSKPCPVGCANSSVTNPVTGFSNKPLEHIYEIGFAVGGPISIPHLLNGHDRLFFYAAYDKYRNRLGANFTSASVPTTLMRQGNFQELLTVANGGLGNTSGVNYPIYDPTTQAACTAHTGSPCRYQYGYGPGAGTSVVATGAPINVIPASQQSLISQYQQSFLPPPTTNTTGVIASNFLGGSPTGYDNWIYSGRIDYDISDKQRLSFLLTGGNRHAVPYTGSSPLPYPYISTTLSTVGGHIATMEDSYTITPHLVNQFKYGFINFGGPPVQAPTYGTKYSAAAAGITGLPAGQASQDFPNTTFSGNTPPTAWVGNNPSSTTVNETYEIVDNVQWVKGNHAMNFGLQFQWLEINASAQDTPSQQLPITWSSNDTANVNTALTSYIANTGSSYASFLLGAVNSASVTQQPFSTYGGRFHNFSPYVQDDWKVTPKLTVNLGLRWDYLPSYREVLDRMTFLNPNITNPITGNLGSIQFAGNYGGPGVSCNCHNDVNTWWKNFGPRLGLAYSVNDKTVIRAAYAILYTHAGGVGGASGNDGTGTLGFTSPVPFADSPVTGPAFYLNNAPAFSSVSPASGGGGVPTPNSNFGGPGFTFPASAAVTAASQGIGTGYYVCSGQPASVNPTCNGASGISAGNGSSAAYADPYLGDRAPEISFYNLGVQREITNNLTISVNYVGSQSHFLTGTNLRGLQAGQLNPGYLATLGNTNLIKAATAANLSALSLSAPYAGYPNAAAVNANATIAHMLTWMPQYAGTSDTFGDVANANYNALQLTLSQRYSHGLTFTVNYTYSKSIDDAGTSRSGWAIPSSVTSDGKAWPADRIDRSRSVNDLPQLLTVFGVYRLPFGKGAIGGDHFVVRALASGWQVSEIYQYTSGLPIPVLGTAAATPQNTGQGTYMPDYNPNFKGSPRINGKWGQGTTAQNLGTIPYIQGYINTNATAMGTSNNAGSGASIACAASVGPFCNTQNNTIGNLTRVAPYQLRGQNIYRLTMAVSRTFDITNRFKFVFRVDCQNVTNHTTFGNNYQNISGGYFNNNVNSSNFGTVGGASADARAFQLSGRINF